MNSDNINSFIIDYSIAKEIGVEILQKHNIFPIQQQELFLLIATSTKILDETYLMKLFQSPIKFIQVPYQNIQLQIHNLTFQYEIYTLGIKALNNSSKNDMNNSYISDMINKMILFGIKYNASDIHIEALKDNVIIRFRIDGIMHLYFTFEYEMYTLFSSIIKLFANLDISQSRLPQNGRFSKTFNDKNIFDFRVSTMPTINGESIVLRILDNKNCGFIFSVTPMVTICICDVSIKLELKSISDIIYLFIDILYLQSVTIIVTL